MIYTLDQSSPIEHNKEPLHDCGVEGQPHRVPPSAVNDRTFSINHTSANKTGDKKVSWMGWSALVDRGANGSIAGQEMRIIAKLDKTIDLSGIDDHTVSNLRLVTAGGVVRTQLGDILSS